MRCHICDRVLSEPRFNSDHKDYDPCDTCLEVVYDVLGSYRDKPAAEEDELGSPHDLAGYSVAPGD